MSVGGDPVWRGGPTCGSEGRGSYDLSEVHPDTVVRVSGNVGQKDGIGDVLDETTHTLDRASLTVTVDEKSCAGEYYRMDGPDSTRLG